MVTKFVNDVDKHEILKQAAIYSYDVKKNKIPQGFPVGFASSAENCPGTYYVDGYTRADGTEVSGYQRSCGVHGNAGGIRKKRIDEMTPQELDDFLERFL